MLRRFERVFYYALLSFVLIAACLANAAEQMPRHNDEHQITTKLEQCMELIDQSVTRDFLGRGVKLNRDIDRLCHDGKRNKAQNQASEFALALARSTDVASYRKCSKLMPDESPELQKLVHRYSLSDLRFRHACEYKEPE